jgi:trimethylamine---corrinoid protein Co-methyltransferase
MTPSHLVQPHLSLLSEEQKVMVHGYALKVLSQTGVRVDSQAIQEILRNKVGQSILKGDIAYLPEELVEWAIQAAPPTAKIYNRSGELAFHLGADRTRFGIGVTTLYYQDPITDELSPFNRQNMQDMVRLGHCLPNFDVISTIGVIQDTPVELSDLYAALEMVANTTKPLVILVSDENRFNDVLDLIESLSRDLAERPFVIPYFNPVTPLLMNRGTLDKMTLAIQRGLPVIFSNYSLAGMSTPITPAGMLAVLLAELLAGLTIGQLIKENAPMILGILPAFMDMKTMVNFYDPQSMLLNLACAEMMAHYQLPHCGTSGSGTGWGPDLLAAETYWMNHITAVLTKGGLAPFVGDTLASKAFSPTNVVYTHEIIEQALRYARGFSIDEDSVGLDEIQKAGPTGNFLDSRLTLQNYRSAYYTSPIFPRWSKEKWVEKGRPPAINILRKHTVELLNSLTAPDDHDNLLEQGEEFILKRMDRG